MIQQKIQIATARLRIISAALVVLAVFICVPVHADAPSTCPVGTEQGCPLNNGQCSSVDPSVKSCTDPAASSSNCTSTSNCDLLTQYVQPFINFLSALVGVAVTISIVIGGIQYGSSAGDSSKVSAAKNRIRNSIIALLAFIFLYAMLNFLIPGGLV